VAKFIGRWVAKLEGDGWISGRGWVAKFIGRWVAKFEGDGWLS
jgi:hypothetical protein